MATLVAEERAAGSRLIMTGTCSRCPSVTMERALGCMLALQLWDCPVVATTISQHLNRCNRCPTDWTHRQGCVDVLSAAPTEILVSARMQSRIFLADHAHSTLRAFRHLLLDLARQRSLAHVFGQAVPRRGRLNPREGAWLHGISFIL